MTEPMTSEKKAGMNLLRTITQQQVILTASICLIALAIVLKNVLFVPSEILIRDMVMYTIVSFGFLIFAFNPEGNSERSGTNSPLVWDVLIVLITLAIIVVYAL
ncbi:MAG: hypothetical protein LUO87_01985 [Methanomicrobiales archaeon]|nr:hypothetical protein [Methanomicrobiales archaeon]